MSRRAKPPIGEPPVAMTAAERAQALERLAAEVARRKAAQEVPGVADVVAPSLPPGVVELGGAVPEVMGAIAAIQSRTQVASQADLRGYIWREQIVPRLKQWGWPPRARQEIGDWNCPEQEATYRVCAERLQGQGAIVALIGKFGTGKTSIAAQLAVAAAWRERADMLAALEARGPVRVDAFLYRTLTDLMAVFKPLYIGAGSIDADRLTERRERLCTEPNTLVIDEMHALSEVAARDALLIDLVNRRYEHRRDTFLISNETPEEFDRSTHASIRSRIHEHGVILRCEWDSWREKLAEVPARRR